MLKFALAAAGVAVVVAYAVGSGRWVQVSQGWYAALERPAWQPPVWVFGAVWAYCFVMLAVVAALVGWRGPAAIGVPASVAWLALLAATAVLAVTWAWLFYGVHALAPSAVALTACGLLTIPLLVIGSGVSSWIAVALAPYQAWLLIATSLSWGYAVLNRHG